MSRHSSGLVSFLAPVVGMFLGIVGPPSHGDCPAAEPAEPLDTQAMLRDYYATMSEPKPFVVCDGDDWLAHRDELRGRLLASAGLAPLPDRPALDVHESQTLDHPWCTVRRIAYQLWPGVYSEGLLVTPKELSERPAPAVLCPHGHWADGFAHPDVQTRLLNLARLGYVTFSSTQNHYEDPNIGISHQTQMIWNNIRALDYLQSLPEVDGTRIGVAGASGGGLQTQMITALDDRVKAATIVGLTCDFREIMFPDHNHCVCNHFPGVMRFTDHPETSALGLPTPVQFLTMNDWTKNFGRDNLADVEALYAANDAAGRIDFQYYDTPHSYEAQKRERTYWWMDRWLRNVRTEEPDPEPDDSQPFEVEAIKGLTCDVPGNRGFSHISAIYQEKFGYAPPDLADRNAWNGYREEMAGHLQRLLGEDAVLPRETTGPRVISSEQLEGLVVEHITYPSEGGIRVPTIVIRSSEPADKAPLVVFCGPQGGEPLLADSGDDSPLAMARRGALVALPDVRVYGRLLATGSGDEARQREAWQRNGIVWGRPTVGMTRTDLGAVLDGLLAREDVDSTCVTLVTRDSAGLAIGALFTAALDGRVTSVDVDLNGGCFACRNVPLVPFVLRHGDVLQWAALLADRKLVLHNVPSQAGDSKWLANVFSILENGDGLTIE